MPSSQTSSKPQIKGVAMLNAVRALRSLGKDRARELLPERMHKYLGDERILPMAWYPETEMLELNRALAQIIRPTLGGASLEETFVHMGRLGARMDLAGVYASRIRDRPLADAAQRVGSMWKQYHDTGTLAVSLQPNVARFELRDYGLPSRELCWIQRGWFHEYMTQLGAADCEVVETQCRIRAAHSCIWQATWRTGR